MLSRWTIGRRLVSTVRAVSSYLDGEDFSDRIERDLPFISGFPGL